MDQNILNEIKNRIYETEGLLELLQIRAEKADEILPLINMRFRQAADLLSELIDEKTKDEKMPADSDFMTSEEETVANTEAPSETFSRDAGPAIEEEDNLYQVSVEDEDIPVKEKSEIKPQSNSSNPAFCLNDRFRFRRALFGGNNQDFNAVMDYVATLSNFEEAEDYFYGERGFEPEDEDVMDFMEIIRKYFDK